MASNSSAICKVYADKIRYQKINPATGKAWTINDVPAKYREEVQRILDEE